MNQEKSESEVIQELEVNLVPKVIFDPLGIDNDMIYQDVSMGEENNNKGLFLSDPNYNIYTIVDIEDVMLNSEGKESEDYTTQSFEED